MKLVSFKAYKVVTRSGLELYAIVLPVSYVFMKYGRTDVVGKLPLHHLEHTTYRVEEMSLSDEVFFDFFQDIIEDVFEKSQLYVNYQREAK